jgi:hypothetical protein
MKRRVVEQRKKQPSSSGMSTQSQRTESIAMVRLISRNEVDALCFASLNVILPCKLDSGLDRLLVLVSQVSTSCLKTLTEPPLLKRTLSIPADLASMSASSSAAPLLKAPLCT